MTVDGAGGQHGGDRLAAILIGADITGLVVIGVAGMAIQAAGRVLGIGLGDDIDHCGSTGVVTKATVVFMLDQDIVPIRQVAAAAIVTDGTGLAIKSISAEADQVVLAAAVRAVVVTGKIADMALDALPVGCSGGGGRAFQGAVGGQVMAGGATASGMNLASANKG